MPSTAERGGVVFGSRSRTHLFRGCQPEGTPRIWAANLGHRQRSRPSEWTTSCEGTSEATPFEGSPLASRIPRTSSVIRAGAWLVTTDPKQYTGWLSLRLGSRSMRAPKVFISHASEDKERFVLSFATELRTAGVDSWVDEWEILPGDSIVRKIFSEGIDGADAIVVVLSRVSVRKSWVQEELDAAVVQRITKETRLIPVVLDGLTPEEVPVPLRHLLWIRADQSDVGGAAGRVVDAVFEVNRRPLLQAAPAYVQALGTFEGLGAVDSLVLRRVCVEAIDSFGENFDTAEFVASLEDVDLAPDAALESLEVLHELGYVKILKTFAQGILGMRHFSLTSSGMELYLNSTSDYASSMQIVCTAIVNGGSQGSDEELSAQTGVPRLVVLHVLRVLAARGLVKLSQAFGPSSVYYGASPRLRRLIEA